MLPNAAGDGPFALPKPSLTTAISLRPNRCSKALPLVRNLHAPLSPWRQSRSPTAAALTLHISPTPLHPQRCFSFSSMRSACPPPLCRPFSPTCGFHRCPPSPSPTFLIATPQALPRLLSAPSAGAFPAVSWYRGGRCTARDGGSKLSGEEAGEGWHQRRLLGETRVFSLAWVPDMGPRAWKRASDSAHDYHPICALDWTVRGTNVRSRYKVTSCCFSLCLNQKNKQLTGCTLVHHKLGWDNGQLFQQANGA